MQISTMQLAKNLAQVANIFPRRNKFLINQSIDSTWISIYNGKSKKMKWKKAFFSGFEKNIFNQNYSNSLWKLLGRLFEMRSLPLSFLQPGGEVLQSFPAGQDSIKMLQPNSADSHSARKWTPPAPLTIHFSVMMTIFAQYCVHSICSHPVY